MSADRGDEGTDAERGPGQPVPMARGTERGGHAGGRGELDAWNESRGRAVSELAAENAELYQRIGSLEAQLKTQRDKFSAWAGQVGVRDDERAARDEARDRREEALADRITQLEQRPAATDPGGAGSRIDATEAAGRQGAKPNPERLWRGNEAIATYAAGGGIALTVLGEAMGSTATEVTGIAGTVAGFAATAIALARKHREDHHADRPER